MMHHHWKIGIIAGSFACLCLTGPIAQSAGTTQKVTLFFSDDNLIGSADCAAVRATSRNIAATGNPLDTALRLLLRGPTKEEQADGLVAFYEHPVLDGSAHESKRPLRYYYRGVSVIDGVATVKFSKDALSYFNRPGCQKTIVTEPIVKTLEQFGNVKDVRIVVGIEQILGK